MGEALGNVLPLAIGIAIFPIPLIAAVLIVGSDRGRTKALAFALAWCAGLAVVGAAVLVLAGAGDASDGGGPATWVSVLLLVLGLLLLGLAVKQWRGRPRGGREAPMPAWMRTIGDFTPAKAGGAGFALSALNPKNVLLTTAAAVEIAEVGLPASRQAGALAAFVVIASAGVLAPLVLSLVLGSRSEALLDGVRGWMARHNAAIMSAVFLLIGAKLIGDAVSGLAG